MTQAVKSGGIFDFGQNSQKVTIKLSSFSTGALDEAVSNLVLCLRKVSAMIVGPIPLPNRKSSIVVNRSPHVDGKSKDKMGIIKHYRMIILLDATSTEIDAISSVSIASGVGVEIQISKKNKANAGA